MYIKKKKTLFIHRLLNSYHFKNNKHILDTIYSFYNHSIFKKDKETAIKEMNSIFYFIHGSFNYHIYESIITDKEYKMKTEIDTHLLYLFLNKEIKEERLYLNFIYYMLDVINEEKQSYDINIFSDSLILSSIHIEYKNKERCLIDNVMSNKLLFNYFIKNKKNHTIIIDNTFSKYSYTLI